MRRKLVSERLTAQCHRRRTIGSARHRRSHMATEGFVQVRGGRVWYRIVSDRETDATPLLLLHGGPGFTSEYVDSLEALSDERPVVRYDQLGCGRSDRPGDSSLWTVERFVEELADVRRALGLERVHILGQSWGSMLAADYLLAGPEGVESVIFASPPLSIPRWVTDTQKLLDLLPAWVRPTMEWHEREGFTACPEYAAAVLEVYRAHLCRMHPWPLALERSLATAGFDVYNTMWGPNEFTVTGCLADYDRTDRLGEITVPTLYTCGRNDEATPDAVAWYQSLTPGSRMVVFEESAHLSHLEEADKYIALVREFLGSVEARDR
jgi:proline-specific peptidase